MGVGGDSGRAAELDGDTTAPDVMLDPPDGDTMLGTVDVPIGEKPLDVLGCTPLLLLTVNDVMEPPTDRIDDDATELLAGATEEVVD